jgi:uncharacterized NAD(P)/FAD-binding protein YdhS
MGVVVFRCHDIEKNKQKLHKLNVALISREGPGLVPSGQVQPQRKRIAHAADQPGHSGFFILKLSGRLWNKYSLT